MAGTSKGGSRRARESDSMEALKPLVVLALFGMILYGAYAVVQKGPTAEPAAALAEAPPFAPPDVQIAPPPVAATTAGPLAAPVATPVAVAPAAPVASPVTLPAVSAAAAEPAPTYLPAEAAAPPSPDQVVTRAQAGATQPIPIPAPPAVEPATASLPVEPAPLSPAGRTTSAAFASAWADAHDKLVAGRYAEALAALSVWYDDPTLGLEESQRLEDLLGQLAGTVIYSQQDLLLPPHVVAPGETLAAVAGPLGVSPQLLAKINGVDDPARLVPGEHLKLVRGPFDAVLSVSRRRISLQLNGAYAGSFPVVVGRRFLEKVGGSLPVVALPDAAAAGQTPARRAIVLGEGLVIEAVDDPVALADAAPPASAVMSVRDLDEVLDILGPASRLLVRQ